MEELKRILLVEDSANDVELTLVALEENHLANEVVVVRDGEEALDYLGANGYVVKPVDFREFVDAIKEVGLFWAVVNEPPPGAVSVRRNNG